MLFLLPAYIMPIYAHNKKNLKRQAMSTKTITFTKFTRNLHTRIDLIEFTLPRAFHSNQFDGESFCQAGSNQHDIKITINRLIADGDSVYSITQFLTLNVEFTCLFVQDRSTLDVYLIAPESFEET
jgi:hypothetical protein